MRASIRGSIRSVIVTDSDDSTVFATAVSISRRSGRFSAQKSASADSLSKIGTSSQRANEFMAIFVSLLIRVEPSSVRQSLVQLALVKIPLFRLQRPGVDDPKLFPVGPINTEN